MNGRPLALTALTSAALVAIAGRSLALAFVLVLLLGTLAVSWAALGRAGASARQGEETTVIGGEWAAGGDQ